MRPDEARGPWRLGGLWTHANFLKFWTGETISFLGSEITTLALPLTAVLVLRATPRQMGVLGAARYLPFLIVGLLAGVWVDRFDRRFTLITTDIAQALLLGSIPLAAAFDRLRIEHLYGVALLVGGISVISMVAYQSFLPSLVPRNRLTEGNSKLEISSSLAQIAGPTLAGILIQIVKAPIAILIDAISFLVSAVFLGLVRSSEHELAPEPRRQGVWRNVREGWEMVWDHNLLRPIVCCGGTHNFFSTMLVTVYILYVGRDLSLSPALIGVILSLGGPGALLGSLLAPRASRRFGLGPTIAGSQVLTGIARLCIPLAGGPFAITIILLATAEFLLGVARPIFNINQVSLRQAITPDRLQGRVNATMRFIMWVLTPAGALLGGVLGEAIGLRSTLLVSAIGVMLASFWTLFSPLPRLLEQPRGGSETAGGAARASGDLPTAQ